MTEVVVDDATGIVTAAAQQQQQHQVQQVQHQQIVMTPATALPGAVAGATSFVPATILQVPAEILSEPQQRTIVYQHQPRR